MHVPRTLLVATVTVIAAVPVGIIGARAHAASLPVSTYTVSTASNELRPGRYNTGFWDQVSTNSVGNDNYFTGNFFGEIGRGFLMFDISSVTNPCPPISASVRIPAGGNPTNAGSPPNATLTLGLFDVLTPPNTLIHVENSPNPAIYADLGSGVNFALAAESTNANSPTVFTVNMNANGLNAIGQALSSHLPFFPVGLSLVNPPAGNPVYLFGWSGHFGGFPDPPPTMTINFPKLCKVYP